ncbi:hypothetical protein [Klebsiella pneumoniae]|uniref:hypothetical protein n=1 Tax=Klebsiella pneumoniae TaxID=573 RepID=UPI0039753731
MIIWINGPFGAGKTTLAKRLRDRRSKSLIFDPEEIGFVVKGPHASERRLSGSPLVEGTYDRGGQGDSKELPQDIIIPMTLVHPDYLTEILDGVRRMALLQIVGGDKLIIPFC